jgi:hypothetical protein
VAPRSEISVFGSFVMNVGEDYYLFTKYQQCDEVREVSSYNDSLTVNGRLYNQVYFVKIIPKNLHKDWNSLDMEPCSLRDVFARKDSSRQRVPGFGEREFLVIEDVVGVR